MRRFASFLVYPPLAAAILAWSWIMETAGLGIDLAIYASIGLLIWTLLEYVLHRFLFHSHAASPTVKTIKQQMHLCHHAAPRDPDQLFVRLRYSLPASALFFGSFWLVSRSVFVSSALLAGLWLGFLYYESVHYRVHLSSRQGWAISLQRRSHFRHHFVDGERRFGVTSPLWDLLLGTY